MFSKYKKIVETAIEEAIPSFGMKRPLRDAVEYALKNGGKRFRPAIVYMVAEALGNQVDVTRPALAVEYFHTASLIADDLPSMDDDAIRRDQPTLHVAFDEATAILATYALIAAGYDCLRSHPDPAIVVLALENAAFNTGIHGATGGQHLDLFPPEMTEETVLEILDKKTGTLFEISFVFGWLYGGGDVKRLDMVKKVAFHLGRAFQISDDFLDQEDGALNYVSIVGHERASSVLQEQLEGARSGLKQLGLDSPELLYIAALIEQRTSAVV